ncbi:division/cell wall cluster transcriptional repressor MraZ [candidate division TA06 bacterium]|nr:division/cell wall cluster transcriptional repressor MraZ [candidate division TA06 bacterium]
MTYQGTYRYSIDNKGRLSVPAKFRKTLLPEANGTFVVTKGFDQCLSVYTLDEWLKFEEKLQQLPNTKKSSRNVVRWFTANAERLEVDNQGRIKIPQHLLEYAGLKKEATIIGALDRIEIWDPETYKANAEEVSSTIEEDLESLDF